MIGPIPKKPSGSGPEAKFMQATWEANYGSGRAQSSSGARVNRTTQGFSIVQRPGRGGSNTSIRTVKLRLVEPEYLVCRSWDGTTLGTTDLYVAKQVLHRTYKIPTGTLPDPLPATLKATGHYGLNGDDPGVAVRLDHVFTYAWDTDEPFIIFVEGNEWGDVESDFEEGGALFERRLNVRRTVTVTVAAGEESAESVYTETQRIIPVWRRGEILHAISSPTYIEVPAQPEADPPTEAILIKRLHCCESRQWARIN